MTDPRTATTQRMPACGRHAGNELDLESCNRHLAALHAHDKRHGRVPEPQPDGDAMAEHAALYGILAAFCVFVIALCVAADALMGGN